MIEEQINRGQIGFKITVKLPINRMPIILKFDFNPFCQKILLVDVISP